MSRKGFTLIELLVTIFILSLIMLVAVPNVMNIVDKNKKETYVNDAKKMITLAEYKLKSDSSIALPNEGSCIIVLMKALDLSDFFIFLEGGEYDTNNSYVVIARDNNKYIYMATIIEKYGDRVRGINLSSRDDLNKEGAFNLVKEDEEIETITPVLNSSIKGYTVSNIIS